MMVKETPFTQELSEKLNTLQNDSNFECQLDINVFSSHETLMRKRGSLEFPFHGNPLELINTYSSCQNCHQAFQMDSYGKGCIHDCLYCFAKVDAEENGVWNAPVPLPLDFSDLWDTFYTVFETDHKNPWRSILEKRIPLRIGANSDSFMAMDRHFKITREVLRLLSHYRYPYFIVTRGEVIAKDDYLKLIDPEIGAVHLSIPSLNTAMTKIWEPAAPSPETRLESLKAINEAGIWTIARINPMFPRYREGFIQNGGDLSTPPELDYFSFDVIDAVAEAGAKGILTGFVSLKGHTVETLSKQIDFDLWSLISNQNIHKGKRFLFDGKEMRAYYEEARRRAEKKQIQFTTCYLGTGEEQYFVHKDLWDNKKDCCNIRERVVAHQSDSSQIGFMEKFSYGHADANPFLKFLTFLCYGLINLIIKLLKKEKAS